MTETRVQKMAQKAFEKIQFRKNGDKTKAGEYRTFALSFPSLIHDCGLCQALSFAQSKEKKDYIADLKDVLKVVEEKGDCLEELSRISKLPDYIRLSEWTLKAAEWLKRYASTISNAE